MSDGDTGFEKELLNLFSSDAKDRLSQIENSLAQEDSEGLIVALHTLKGAAANVGAEAIRELADKMEKHAKNKDFLSIKNGQDELNKRLSSTIKEIEDWK